MIRQVPHETLRQARFHEQKEGFRQILADPHWLAKIMLGGFLLINPFLVAMAPSYLSGHEPAWVRTFFPWALILRFHFLVSTRLYF